MCKPLHTYFDVHDVCDCCLYVRARQCVYACTRVLFACVLISIFSAEVVDSIALSNQDEIKGKKTAKAKRPPGKAKGKLAHSS